MIQDLADDHRVFDAASPLYPYADALSGLSGAESLERDGFAAGEQKSKN